MSIGFPKLDGSGCESISALNELHDALLPGTIRNALQTGFYRERWAGCDLGRMDRERLAHLPLIGKEDIRAAGSAAQNRAGVVCNEILTSGTTGCPLVTVRSETEQAFIREFFTRQLGSQPVRFYLRGLQFTSPYHGHLINVPSPTHFHRVSVYDAGSFEYGRRILTDLHEDSDVDPRCSVLTGLERCLRAFTADTNARYPDGFPPTSLRVIVSTSQFVTKRWKERLESTWHAPLVDRFSVSEVFGGAGQCLQCGWYHFDPHVLPEVVGTHSGELMKEGSGLLALTALFPFQQAQPLVRYLTGDLVDVTYSSSCRPGVIAIKPLGRAQYGVPEPNSDRWLMTPSSVLEAIDDIPDMQRIPRFGDVEQVVDPESIGHPRYQTRWSFEDSTVAIDIRIALRKELTSERIAVICDAIRDAVQLANPLLQSHLAEGKASLTVSASCDLKPDLISQSHSGGVWSDT